MEGRRVTEVTSTPQTANRASRVISRNRLEVGGRQPSNGKQQPASSPGCNNMIAKLDLSRDEEEYGLI